MSAMRFSKDHEWVKVDGGVATVGITSYAQEQLGDVVFVELPAVGKKVKAGEEAAVVESVKAASEIFAPISGEVIAGNDELATKPEVLNSAPHTDGWIAKIKLSNPQELSQLLSAADYQAFLAVE